ncbi:unnamed protein product [Spirodela intermedia]|uniref:Uncharacterized protein n=1 Tax=Spirodela intermedia TaxID=51605 RepID=A0A7I8KY43_SPIIN|nr:unnamed protein product [Spirodela intermedia]
MRLMGTNVTIGRSTKEHRALSDIKTWVDKKAMTGFAPKLKIPETFSEQDPPPECVVDLVMNLSRWVFTRQRQYAVKKMFVSICF